MTRRGMFNCHGYCYAREISGGTSCIFLQKQKCPGKFIQHTIRKILKISSFILQCKIKYTEILFIDTHTHINHNILQS